MRILRTLSSLHLNRRDSFRNLDGSALSRIQKGRLLSCNKRQWRPRWCYKNARKVENVRIPWQEVVPIRGEVVMRKSVFEESQDFSKSKKLQQGRFVRKADGKADASDLVFLAYDAKFPGSIYPDERTAKRSIDSLLRVAEQRQVSKAPWVVRDWISAVESLCKETEA